MRRQRKLTQHSSGAARCKFCFHQTRHHLYLQGKQNTIYNTLPRLPTKDQPTMRPHRRAHHTSAFSRTTRDIVTITMTPIEMRTPHAWVPSISDDDSSSQHTASGGHASHRHDLGPFQILIPISVAAWILFGASCILCINGKGRAGRWVPEWYLDSRGSHWDRAMVAA